MKVSSVVKAGMVVCAIGCCSSCGRREPKPRTGQQIDVERMNLPVVHLTASGKEVIIPGNEAAAAVLDPGSGELAYPARICTNPDCPGKGDDARPYLFIWKDPTAFINDEDGSVSILQPDSQEDFLDMCKEKGVPPQPSCPACLKLRNPDTESKAEAQKYRDWVQLYVPPETAKRRKELDEEHKRRIEELKRRKKRKP